MLENKTILLKKTKEKRALLTKEQIMNGFNITELFTYDTLKSIGN
jgi:hypothetical protein